MSGEKASYVPIWLVVFLGVLLILYMFFDVSYFLRMTFTIFRARYFKSKICILDTAITHSWCFSNDVDTLLYHMNNARYLRELDFARADFYERTGLWAYIRKCGGAVVQGATTIRYRRFLKPGTTFRITSKAVYWDDKSVFMDHEFISPDGFINAVATCRQRVIDCSAENAVNMLHQMQCGDQCKAIWPTNIPPEIAAWVEANEISSAKIRKTKCSCDPLKCLCIPTLTQTQPNELQTNGHV